MDQQQQDQRLSDAEAAVNDWNRRHPVGRHVTVTRANGTTFRSSTRRAAEVATPGGNAVVWLKGLCGCWGLDQVTPSPAAVRG